MDQIGIALTGAIAIWLSQDERRSWNRWACIFGLAGEPFWFLASYRAEQWGVFALAILYTIGWMRGVRNNWMGGSMFGFISRWIKARKEARQKPPGAGVQPPRPWPRRPDPAAQEQEIPPLLAKGGEFKPTPPRLTSIRACAEDRAARSKLPPPTRPASPMPAVKPVRTESRSSDDDSFATTMLLQSMSSGPAYVPPARVCDSEPFSGRGGSADGGGASGDWSSSSSSCDSGGSSLDSSSCSAGD
jgi:uncharacterized membrane protein YgcG